ncbi:MAG: replication protein [Thermoanaerobacter sp.]|nr:replication protein [Thermoanaerobacter sp.]
MAEQHKGKIIKCDQKVNITATFGSDLVLEGSTAIPNILLKVYSKIGITDFQMMILIQMIRLNVEEGEFYPTPEMLGTYMESEPSRIKKELADLLEKEVIAISQYYDSGRNVIFEGYDFEPLFLKVSDIWAGIRAREIEECEKRLKAANYRYDFAVDRYDSKTASLLSTFEKEFGRALSPIEVEQIEQWAAEIETPLIIEALKRAVLRGKHNFKYINSILVEWQKNNLRTLESIAEYDRDFQKRRSGRGKRGGEAGTGQEITGSKNDAKKKAFIRSLYV